MALGFNLVFGPTGNSGPNAAGEFSEELISITGDGAATSGTYTPKWLRQIDAVLGGGNSTIVLNNGVSPPTAAFTFGAALGNGAIVYATVRGRR